MSLAKMYNKFTKDFQVFFLLGETTPTALDSIDNIKEILNLFIYTYSFLGLSSDTIGSTSKIKVNILSEYMKIKNKHILTTKQKWWAICLIYFKIGSEHYKIESVSSLTKYLLLKCDKISEHDLAIYCNMINDNLCRTLQYDLRIRPSMDTLDNNSINNNSIFPIYSSLLLKKDEIISTLKKSGSTLLFTNNEVKRELSIANESEYNIDEWNIVFDVFCSNMLRYNEPSISPFDDDDDLLINSIEMSIRSLTSMSCISMKFVENISSLLENILTETE